MLYMNGLSLVSFNFDRRSFVPNRLFRLAKKEIGTIRYGYRTWGTHARWFSQTLTHGKSKNEIRQSNRRRSQEERSEYRKKQSGHENKKFSCPLCPLSHPNQNTIIINIIL